MRSVNIRSVTRCTLLASLLLFFLPLWSVLPFQWFHSSLHTSQCSQPVTTTVCFFLFWGQIERWLDSTDVSRHLVVESNCFMRRILSSRHVLDLSANFVSTICFDFLLLEDGCFLILWAVPWKCDLLMSLCLNFNGFP